MTRKGILLAGGTGSRLHPITSVVSKQLLPVYDKPMVYYPLSVLMLAGVRDILLISTPVDLPQFKRLLGDGSNFGLNLAYAEQSTPRGLADSILIARDFLGQDPSVLVLGDNIFYGQGFRQLLAQANQRTSGATIFGYPVNEPERYGVVELDQDGTIKSLEEKPQSPKSRYAIPGLYFYDGRAVELAEQLTPSSRGELEITDLNRLYLEQDLLEVVLFSRGFAWLDAGTHDSLHEASAFVCAVEKRQGLKIGCPEEIAYRNRWIDRDQLNQLAERCTNEYGNYLRSVDDSTG